MSGMFSRLSKKVSEDEQLEIILHNIRPCYASTLASVTEITTIEALRTLCRNYENIQARLSHFREPSGVTPDSLAPEFAYSSSNQTKKQNYNDNKNYNYNKNYNNNFNKNNNYTNKNEPKNYIHSMVTGNRTRFCLRCKSDAHNLRQCPNRDVIVCFRCGRDGVKTPDCPDCNKHKPISKN
ncbi:hypothetical protein JYU34_015382 [Plutella xylostella]|uniref:CCHC-type domain-containing protein n=1 Tax=Plutella xylostella TaxID=51655 RepID=A0ABQ7Q712_PLUXY|nr:hypothetical protein JYU34_015382 [Plutella xylostella]